MRLSQELTAVVQEKSLLRHPFYEAWTRGALSLDTLRYYAGQYWHQVSHFPRWVSAVHSRCPDLAARKVLLQNLVDEELHGADHPSLWLDFARGLGLAEEAVRAAPVHAKTRATVDELHALTQGDWTEGLCALFAYESQVPEVSRSKMDGLKAHYDLHDDAALAFFQTHLEYDVLHSEAVARLVDRHARPASAKEATERAAQALWTFLDGVAEHENISCI